MNEISELVSGYQKWLRDKTALRQVSEWTEITTPYIDRHNDYLQIYIKKSGTGYILTDDGYVLNDLTQSGCSIDTPRRQSLLKTVLNGFGVQHCEHSLEVHATTDNFSLRKHNLIQAMLAVNDMFYLARPIVTSIFFEEVVNWLDENDIRYTPNVKFTGKSGYDHRFDFAIPKSRSTPERILRIINNPTRDQAEAMAFAWIDTKEVRAPSSEAFTILNDNERQISSSVSDALVSYDVTPISWSTRGTFIEHLAG